MPERPAKDIHYAKSYGDPRRWHGLRLAAFSDARKARMPRRRNRLNWVYDNDLQQFTTPSGRIITLAEIAELLHDSTHCHHDFAGPWTGWRMRQNRLIPPGATFRTTHITSENLPAFNRWLRSFEGEQAQLEFRTSNTDHSPPPACSPAAYARTAAHECTARPSNAQGATEVPAYEPRQRPQVIDLASYRKRAR